jgi:hypothetical protein
MRKECVATAWRKRNENLKDERKGRKIHIIDGM